MVTVHFLHIPIRHRCMDRIAVSRRVQHPVLWSRNWTNSADRQNHTLAAEARAHSTERNCHQQQNLN